MSKSATQHPGHSPTAFQWVGVASSLGAPITGCEQAPETLRQAGILRTLNRHGVPAQFHSILHPDTPARHALPTLLERLASTICQIIEQDQRALIIGADHSIAAGSWRGVGRALKQPLGLIWIDAHLDAHTLTSTPSGNPHGMPVASLLNAPECAFSDLTGPALDPQRLVIIGAHSYEPAELELLRAHGVLVYDMNVVRAQGFAAVFEAARAHIGSGHWGISLDLDALDPAHIPAVGSPSAGGLQPAEVLHTLQGVLHDPQLVAFELTEFNPLKDEQQRSLQWIVQLFESMSMPPASTLMQWEADYGANNYASLPVILTQARGCWAHDVHGKRYLDMMSAYSATSFGHAHPKLLAALNSQAQKIAVTSRAFRNDRLPVFLRRLCTLTGYERALPVNTGLEAVETALKAARKWAYQVKGVAPEQAQIIACEGNFHGRSIAIVGLSHENQYRDGFGPYPAGLLRVPYGDVHALERAITPHTAAFLVEPIQGEGGIIVPPAGYLSACARLCQQHNVLFLADEVQTGLGRTGTLLACEHEGVRPDGVILGKALGGGLLPVSAFLADDRVMHVFRPGDHGSTFGGNPLACAVALAALEVLLEEELITHSAQLGHVLLQQLQDMAQRHPCIRTVRGRGLLAGIELHPEYSAHQLALDLLKLGVLTKDTHQTVLRLAPALLIREDELLWGLQRIERALQCLSTIPKE